MVVSSAITSKKTKRALNPLKVVNRQRKKKRRGVGEKTHEIHMQGIFCFSVSSFTHFSIRGFQIFQSTSLTTPFWIQ